MVTWLVFNQAIVQEFTPG